MPVPSTMADLAQLAGSNSPAGTEVIGNSLDNYIRALSAIVRSTNAVSSATIASASTTDLASSDGERVTVTGTATITSLGTGFAGCRREVVFSGALTLTHSANLVLPGATNFTTAANDVLTFRCIASGQWALVAQSRPNPLTALGYTPVNRAGDTMTGALTNSQTVISGTSSGELRVGGQTGADTSTVFRFDGTMATATGGVAGAFSSIWNTSNFDPALKANLATPTFTGSGSPAAPAGYAVSASGAFGGGYRLIDGATQMGLYAASGEMSFAIGDSSSLNRYANLSTGGLQLGSGFRVSSVTVSSSAPGALAQGQIYFQY